MRYISLNPPNRTPCASTKDRFYCIEIENVAEPLVALTPREVCKVHTDACAMEDVLDRGDVGVLFRFCRGFFLADVSLDYGFRFRLWLWFQRGVVQVQVLPP